MSGDNGKQTPDLSGPGLNVDEMPFGNEQGVYAPRIPVESEEEQIDMAEIDPVALEAAQFEKNKETERTVEEVKSQQKALQDRINSTEKKSQEVQPQDVFKNAEESTYNAVESALKSRVEEIVKEKQGTIITQQKKDINKEGWARVLYTILYTTRIVQKPELNMNPSIDRKEVLDYVLEEFTSNAEKKVSQVRKGVNNCSTQYDGLDEKCDSYDDTRMDILTFYEGIQEQKNATLK